MALQKKLLAVLIGGTGLAASSLAFGHGALVDPPVRQVSCIQQGPLTGICKEASDKSNDGGQSIYTWQELTGFVGGDHSAEQAKKEIPSHLICSGTSKGSGFNMASANWKTTLIKPDINGKVKMRYGYTQPHTPSWIEFYINRKDIDPTKKVIGWDDIEPLDTVTSSQHPVPISGQTPGYTSYEDFNIEIPADRTGRAVIFARWQRNDIGNEGFYGCSDVMITERGSDTLPDDGGDSGGEEPGPVDWFEYAKFAENQKPEIGETVVFRMMSGIKGSDLINIRKPINASNAGEKWITELATEINKNHSNVVLIGQKSNSGNIELNTQQPRSNGIYLNNTGHSAVLTVEAAANQPVAVVPANFEVESTTGESAAYPMDGSKSKNAVSYRWKVVGGEGTFWLQEKQAGGWVKSSNKDIVRALIPANTTGKAVYELTVTSKDGKTHSNRVTVTVKEKSTGGSEEYPLWQSGKTYVAGDKVTFEGIKYIASYWTQAKPGSNDSWKLADKTQVVEWKASMTYVAGDNVTYQGKKYTAKQWTVGNQPDKSPNIWTAQ